MKRFRGVLFGCMLLLSIAFFAATSRLPAQAQEKPEKFFIYLPMVRTDPTIRIATHLPLSGASFQVGTSMNNGAQLGLRQSVAGLERLGFNAELVPFDDSGSSIKAAQNAAEIVANKNILCVVGHFNSEAALAALPTYRDANLLMITPANTAPAITDSFTNTVRLVGRDDIQGVLGLRFAKLGPPQAQSVYILHDTSEYGQVIAEAFRDEARRANITVTGFVSTTATSVFDPLFEPIRAANPDLVYFATGDAAVAGTFFGQARDPQRGNLPTSIDFLGPDGLDEPELTTFAGQYGAGIYYSTIARPVSTYTTTNQSNFVQTFTDSFGTPPRALSAVTYDATALCAQAIRQAAADAGRFPTRAEVLAAVRSFGGFNGLVAKGNFTANGDLLPAEYYVLQTDVDNDWENNQLIFEIGLPAPTP